MASLTTQLAFLTVFLVLNLRIAKNDVCKEVECGRGKCNPESNGTFPYYRCDCDLGWRQTRLDNDTNLKFLPCIVPNCTLNSACAAAPPPPVQDKAANVNESFFDICRWADCGGGSCNKTSPFTYNCKCSEGYFNLLNASAFPCYRECAIGMDCANLGIPMSNTSSPPSPASSQNEANKGNTPTSPQNDVNKAGSKLLGDCHWLIMSVLLLAFVA